MLRNSNVPLQCISKYLLAGQHGQTVVKHFFYIWDKVFKIRLSEICEMQPLKSLKWYGLFWEGVEIEISFWVEWNILILVSGQSLITVFMLHPKMKSIASVISLC